ncbi:hypothetical protein [Streptomyces sp. GbtcB7]|uniref:hypothetical protein n=1 Tax=Streptomyces sp. GbtcB7 TaxID=2824752 RepID=UPI001C30BE63|nr:hypothetical protein [Streptomyces sp. GbtcB7]
MSLPLIRLAIGRTNGTAHHGVLLDTGPLTACATHTRDLEPIGENTAHHMCQSCTRALLVLTTLPHEGGEPEFRPGADTGKSAVAHRPIPGHLLGYCGKPLDNRCSAARRVCANCTGLGAALDGLRHRAGDLLVSAGEPCHTDDTVLWAPSGRDNLVTGHCRDVTTGQALCARPLSGPNPGAPNECAPCRRIWQEAEAARQTHTLPRLRRRARWWPQRRQLDTFDDRTGTLRPGDAYALSGCVETHHVVTAVDRSRRSHTHLVAYLPTADRIVDVRLHRDRLVTVQRPY